MHANNIEYMLITDDNLTHFVEAAAEPVAVTDPHWQTDHSYASDIQQLIDENKVNNYILCHDTDVTSILIG